MARWYIISYRHPGDSPWRDYGEPVSASNFPTMIRFVEQMSPFSEVRIKILDVKEGHGA